MITAFFVKSFLKLGIWSMILRNLWKTWPIITTFNRIPDRNDFKYKEVVFICAVFAKIVRSFCNLERHGAQMT